MMQSHEQAISDFIVVFVQIVVVTILCLLVNLVAQQSYRSGANDPQIQISEDAATALSQGADPRFLIGSSTMINSSLAPFMIVENRRGEILSSSALLPFGTGTVSPSVPDGVVEYTLAHGQDRITWQPRDDVRAASVVSKWQSETNSGVVLVGRSLREVEKRVSDLNTIVFITWLMLITCIVVGRFLHRFLQSFFRKRR